MMMATTGQYSLLSVASPDSMLLYNEFFNRIGPEHPFPSFFT